jgi:hypothetical protein
MWCASFVLLPAPAVCSAVLPQLTAARLQHSFHDSSIFAAAVFSHFAAEVVSRQQCIFCGNSFARQQRFRGGVSQQQRFRGSSGFAVAVFSRQQRFRGSSVSRQQCSAAVFGSSGFAAAAFTRQQRFRDSSVFLTAVVQEDTEDSVFGFGFKNLMPYHEVPCLGSGPQRRCGPLPPTLTTFRLVPEET